MTICSWKIISPASGQDVDELLRQFGMAVVLMQGVDDAAIRADNLATVIELQLRRVHIAQCQNRAGKIFKAVQPCGRLLVDQIIMRGLVNRLPVFFLAQDADDAGEIFADGGGGADGCSGADNGQAAHFPQGCPPKRPQHRARSLPARADVPAAVFQKNAQAVRQFKGERIGLKQHVAGVRQHHLTVATTAFLKVRLVEKKTRAMRVHVSRREVAVKQRAFFARQKKSRKPGPPPPRNVAGRLLETGSTGLAAPAKTPVSPNLVREQTGRHRRDSRIFPAIKKTALPVPATARKAVQELTFLNRPRSCPCESFTGNMTAFRRRTIFQTRRDHGRSQVFNPVSNVGLGADSGLKSCTSSGRLTARKARKKVSAFWPGSTDFNLS